MLPWHSFDHSFIDSSDITWECRHGDYGQQRKKVTSWMLTNQRSEVGVAAGRRRCLLACKMQVENQAVTAIWEPTDEVIRTGRQEGGVQHQWGENMAHNRPDPEAGDWSSHLVLTYFLLGQEIISGRGLPRGEPEKRKGIDTQRETLIYTSHCLSFFTYIFSSPSGKERTLWGKCHCSIICLRKQILMKVKSLVHGHTAGKWQSQHAEGNSWIQIQKSWQALGTW